MYMYIHRDLHAYAYTYIHVHTHAIQPPRVSITPPKGAHASRF